MLLTVKDQEKKIKSEAAGCVAEVKRIKAECREDVKYARERSFDRLDDIRARLKDVKALGGVCDVYEAARVLKVSRQRVQTLIGAGRIRLRGFEVSLGDVKAYAKGKRKAGRPKTLRGSRRTSGSTATKKKVAKRLPIGARRRAERATNRGG